MNSNLMNRRGYLNSFCIAIGVFIFSVFAGNALASWKSQYVGTTAWLHSVHFVDVKLGWLVGSGGTVLFTHDGGSSWQRKKIASRDNFRDVYFRDENVGWILAESDVFSDSSATTSYLLQTTDGGDTWTKLEFVTDRDRIVKLLFMPSGDALAFGEGGAIWRRSGFTSETYRQIPWIKFDLPTRYLILGGTFTDRLRLYLVGGGRTILYSEDCGETWTSTPRKGPANVKFNSVFFVQPAIGWIVGDAGTILSTKDGGRNWHDEVSGVTEDLTDIVFQNADIGYAVGRNGRILSTVNGGANWVLEQNESKHPIDQLVLTGNKYFAIGFGGTILFKVINKPGE